MPELNPLSQAQVDQALDALKPFASEFTPDMPEAQQAALVTAENEAVEALGIPDSESDIGEAIVELVDEAGESHPFQIIDFIVVDDKDYALLLPINPSDDDDDTVLVLRFNENAVDSEPQFELIEDEAEFQAVVQALEDEVLPQAA